MSNKIENPVVLIHKRENHDSYAVAITNGSHDYYDGLLMASVSPDEADNSLPYSLWLVTTWLPKLRSCERRETH